MRLTPTRVLLLAALLTALLLAADTATATEASTTLIDCFPSSGGSYEVCL